MLLHGSKNSFNFNGVCYGVGLDSHGDSMVFDFSMVKAVNVESSYPEIAFKCLERKMVSYYVIIINKINISNTHGKSSSSTCSRNTEA